MTKLVSAVFPTREKADAAFMRLEAAGFSHTDISLLMSEEARSNFYTIRESSKVDEGTAAGAGIGGIIGAIAGAVASAGVMVIPGLNLIVAGALVSTLAGLGVGGLAGGLVGFLVGAGIPEHEAKYYENEIKEGNVVVSVRTLNSEQEKTAARIFEDLHARKLAA